MVREVKAEMIIVYSGAKGVSFPDFPGIDCLRQRGNDIGERMHNALLDVFALGFERCVLIGSDSPDLPAVLVNDAFDKLDLADAVIGPSTDGGYYLIGYKRQSLCLSIFNGINWSTSGVFKETVKRLDESGFKYTQLPQWSDVDDFDDLKNFYKRNSFRSKESKVMNFLATKGLVNESNA